MLCSHCIKMVPVVLILCQKVGPIVIQGTFAFFSVHIHTSVYCYYTFMVNSSMPFLTNIFSQTHIVTDILCTLEINKNPVQKGVASAIVQRGNNPPSVGFILNFLSTAEVDCGCYYWGEDEEVLQTASCRRTLLLCPYTSPSLNISVKSMS